MYRYIAYIFVPINRFQCHHSAPRSRLIKIKVDRVLSFMTLATTNPTPFSDGKRDYYARSMLAAAAADANQRDKPNMRKVNLI